MSVTMAKADGVTVLTLTSDPESPCPPLCQILGHLCYNPLCWTVSQRYKSVRGNSQTALGTLQIMVGGLHFSLGYLLSTVNGAMWSDVGGSGYPLWFGILFMFFGIMSIWAERRPTPCLVFLSVILNLAGVFFSIAAIVLYSINITLIWLDMCDDEYSPTPPDVAVYKKCIEGRDPLQMLMTAINSVLIILSVLELCVTISASVLGIKTLKKRNERRLVNRQ